MATVIGHQGAAKVLSPRVSLRRVPVSRLKQHAKHNSSVKTVFIPLNVSDQQHNSRENRVWKSADCCVIPGERQQAAPAAPVCSSGGTP